MTDRSLFTDKDHTPTEQELEAGLGQTYTFWKHLLSTTLNLDPSATGIWHYSGKKFGWSYRILDKKRVLVYLLPRAGYFKVAFVFGNKAVQEIMGNTLVKEIKEELESATKYAEGKGIRIPVKNDALLLDIEQLITVKIKF